MTRKSRKEKQSRRGQISRRVLGNLSVLARPQGTATSLLHDTPRKGAVVNVLSMALLDGFILCAFIGATVAWGTSNFISDKLWIYVANTALAMVVKVFWAWLYVGWGRRLAIRIALLIALRGFRKPPGNIPWPEGLPDQANRTVLIVTVATAFATILATEQFNPAWVSDPVHIVWLTALAGTLTAVAESLSVPANIQALWKNRHNYQEGAQRNRSRGRRR